MNEIALAAAVGITIDETDIPLRREVKGMCEILGLDPLYLANEGALVLFVPPSEAEQALAAMRTTKAGVHAAIIGTAKEKRQGGLK